MCKYFEISSQKKLGLNPLFLLVKQLKKYAYQPGIEKNLQEEPASVLMRAKTNITLWKI